MAASRSLFRFSCHRRFGQPAWIGWLGTLASDPLATPCFGVYYYAGPALKGRFLLATGGWYCIQLIQLSWFISHPYLYIYAVYFLLAALIGLQFGFLGMCITVKEINNPFSLLAIAGFWTLMEWGRLFVLSGFSWNPAGMALTSNIYSLQLASVAGIYGLSFWVIFVNLLAVKAWTGKHKLGYAFLWAIAAAFPYAFGAMHLHYHQEAFLDEEKREKNPLNVVLVQTAFPLRKPFLPGAMSVK